jgi:diguanylate cyclase (GGDEF)-like protein
MDLLTENSGANSDPRDIQLRRLEENLRQFERQDAWLLRTAIAIIVLLTLAIVFFSLPFFLRAGGHPVTFHFLSAVLFLAIAVVIFSLYAIYQQRVVRRMRGQLAADLETVASLQSQAALYHELAMLDSLTGLYNRRFGENRLDAEVARSYRHGYPLTVLLLDLDNFKQINDLCGHIAGDAVLKAFAGRLQTLIRTSDLAVRMGGDEFLVLLPECKTSELEDIVSRLRGLTMPIGQQPSHVTFSAGSAGYEHGETGRQLLERADAALYSDKRSRKISPSAPD